VPDPVIIPRAEHSLSRRDIDPDALKVLYRLHHAGYIVYLVGGSVRDLLLGRTPKDFDIGTSAHPYQVKRLFRNCWIIGRRFRLAHVKFGTKVVEVATFRRQVPEDEVAAARDDDVAHDPGDVAGAHAEGHAHQIHRDNTFGTPEEDAFRRDFTVNGLFYDISTFSIIDFVGGIEDLRRRVIRSIGDPNVRFAEDPVRMLRAIVLAARLDFTVDPPVLEAILEHGALMENAAPARLMEEYYKVLRSGAALRAFYLLGEVGLLQRISPEIPWPLPPALERSLATLDEYRARFDRVPETFTNAVLLGSLIAPINLLQPRRRRFERDGDARPLGPTLGALPVARRDVEALQHALSLQPRLADPDNLTPRTQQGLLHRLSFGDALAWLEIHGDAPETVARWRALLAEGVHAGNEPAGHEAGPEEATFGRPGPRRRRRRRRRPSPTRA
jgi:poly(A) polymerase